MPKENLKDKLDGDELDLSLNDLAIIPVKEIAAVQKAKKLDLSCNLITIIPRDFCSTLSHLVKIDLSKNQLQELPDNVGTLQKLQHLDLYANKLTTLPIGMGYLKNLKWLDLKDNPLTSPLSTIAGDCLDETQCRACAKKVVQFMKNAQAEQERQLQKKLQEEREKEAKERAEVEEERKRQKAIKKLEKERRRKEYEAQREQERQKNKQEQNESDSSSEEATPPNGSTIKDQMEKSDRGIGLCGVFLAMIFGVAAVMCGLYFYCQSSKDQFCTDSEVIIQAYYKTTHKLVIEYSNMAQKKLQEMFK